jgi:hypothetical protein
LFGWVGILWTIGDGGQIVSGDAYGCNG